MPDRGDARERSVRVTAFGHVAQARVQRVAAEPFARRAPMRNADRVRRTFEPKVPGKPLRVACAAVAVQRDERAAEKVVAGRRETRAEADQRDERRKPGIVSTAKPRLQRERRFASRARERRRSARFGDERRSGRFRDQRRQPFARHAGSREHANVLDAAREPPGVDRQRDGRRTPKTRIREAQRRAPDPQYAVATNDLVVPRAPNRVERLRRFDACVERP